MATDDDYEIAVIDNETDARACAKLLAEVFVGHNALCVFVNKDPERLFKYWLWPTIQEALGDKLSYFMRRRSTNEIVAAIFATDLYRHWHKHPYDPSVPDIDVPDADLYLGMAAQFVQQDFQQELKPNEVLYIVATGTQAQHAGKGLLKKLNARVCENARNEHGYKYIFVQTSHPATRHLYATTMNGKEMRVVDPATWEWTQFGDGTSRPLQEYVGEPAVNILVHLT